MGEKRKRWDTERNVFVKVGSQSTWEYQGVDPEHGPIDVADVAAAVQKYKLHNEYFTKKGRPKGTKMFATYIYRSMVEDRKYDGNAAYYQLDDEGKASYEQPKNAWKPVDEAIIKFNNHPKAKEKGLFIQLHGKMIDHSGEKNTKKTDEERMNELFK